MTRNAMPDDRELALAPLDEKADHVRGSPAGRLIIEYGDYECPYSRQAFRAIEQVERPHQVDRAGTSAGSKAAENR
jgi:hypothetical protein